MDPQRRVITLPDGRDIEILQAGPAGGMPLVLHEGTPLGLVLYSPTVQSAQARNLRVILIARPGYELSTPRPGRRVVDAAADTAAVLDALGLDRFVTAGGPAAARTRWPASRRCRAGAWRPPRSPASDPTAQQAWTGWRAWARRTWPSSAPPCAGRPR